MKNLIVDVNNHIHEKRPFRLKPLPGLESSDHTFAPTQPRRMKPITKLYQSAVKRRKSKKQMKLGFHQPLSRLYIFIKNEGNCCWYYLDDGRKIYIQEMALTGVIRGLEMKEASTSHGDRLKLDIELVADRKYVLRSGIDSAFSRGVLLTIAALSDEQLKQPITIEVKAGEQKNNVLMSARDPQTFEPIITGSWEGANWESLLDSAIARLGSSQPEPTISEKQYEDLLVKVKASGYTMARFAELLSKYGYTKGSEIAQSSYPEIWAEVGDRCKVEPKQRV